MLVRLLGPVDVLVSGKARPVSGLRRKAVLAVLGLAGGEVVSTDRLLELVWDGQSSAVGLNALQTQISHLRRVLGSRDAIVARGSGYLLNLGDEATDLQLAVRLIERARSESHPDRRATGLQAALDLWRGRPLSDVAGVPWLASQAERLTAVRLEAVLALSDARLELGQHGGLIALLTELVQEHPYREDLCRRLMLALYRAGRQAEALAAYRDLRRRLADELGIDPGTALRELETAILKHDPILDRPADTGMPARVGRPDDPPSPPVRPESRPESRPAAPEVTVPAQLPAVVPSFAGRADELRLLDSILARARAEEPGSGQPTAVVVTAVSGTAGIGKTTLAIHWAQRNVAAFPDGQLYVNLRGFDPSGSALEPAEAIADFLDAFGVPEDRIPAGLTARAGLYRSLVAGRRVLVVLDNARDATQVRPLLPGSPGCLAIVTSRDKLAPLVATEGAQPITLDVLTSAEASDLIARRLGASRVAHEPAAVEDIIARCARLPLALSIAAARAATHPGLALAALAAELGQATDNLDVLHGGDPTTDVRAVFSWSYQTLSVDAARLFRLLGLHPGPDISVAAAASLATVTPDRVRQLLGELTRAHLLNERVPGRYAFHDLLRAYAMEQAVARAGGDLRRGARLRILDHYLRSAHTAALSLFPSWDRIAFDPPRPGVVPESPVGADDALAWFSAEYPVLVAVIEQAAADRTADFDRLAWQLTWAFTAFLHRRGYRDEQAAVQRIGLAAARRAGDPVGRGCLLRGLGLGYVQWGRLDEADAHFQQALEVYQAAGNHAGEAHAVTGLAQTADQRGEPVVALGHAQRALHLFRAAGDDPGYALALNNVGACYSQLGDHRRAVTYCTEAVALLQRLGDRNGESGTWDSLGYAYHNLGDYAQAVVCYQRAIDLCRDLGGGYDEADTLSKLGDTHHAAGDPDAAHQAWRLAVDILEKLNHPDAEDVRRKLGPDRPGVG